MTAYAATEAQPIRCDECGQVVAMRRQNHIEPLGATLQLDNKGRPVIVCPVCGRFTVVRREMREGTT